MNILAIRAKWKALDAGISSILIAGRSLVRGLTLLFFASPKTPLRVLCIVAFDTVHRLRNGKPLPAPRVGMLAALLDLGGCVNAAFDNKDCCRFERRRTLQLLEEAGLGASVAEYLRRLEELESRRPAPAGDHRQFRKVGWYREAVVRLSLGMVAATANGNQSLDEGICATYFDANVNFLFCIAMQCQIMDDVLDYSEDRFAGLPSFLTASRSLEQAFELTRLAALGYADHCDLPRTCDVFALRSALFLVSTCAKLVLVLGRWKHRSRLGLQLPEQGCRTQSPTQELRQLRPAGSSCFPAMRSPGNSGKLTVDHYRLAE